MVNYVKCSHCGGKGYEKCYACSGSGTNYWTEYDDEEGEYIKRLETCPRCGGEGYIDCGYCFGKGEVVDKW